MSCQLHKDLITLCLIKISPCFFSSRSILFNCCILCQSTLSIPAMMSLRHLLPTHSGEPHNKARIWNTGTLHLYVNLLKFQFIDSLKAVTFLILSFTKSRLSVVWTWKVHVLGQFLFLLAYKRWLIFLQPNPVRFLLYAHSLCSQIFTFLTISITMTRAHAIWTSDCNAILLDALFGEYQEGWQAANAGWYTSAWTTAETVLAGTEAHTGGSPKTAQSCQTCWSTVYLD